MKHIHINNIYISNNVKHSSLSYFKGKRYINIYYYYYLVYYRLRISTILNLEGCFMTF